MTARPRPRLLEHKARRGGSERDRQLCELMTQANPSVEHRYAMEALYRRVHFLNICVGQAAKLDEVGLGKMADQMGREVLAAQSKLPEHRLQEGRGKQLVVMGPPGSCKGTMCKRLCARYGLQLLNTGSVLRAAHQLGQDETAIQAAALARWSGPGGVHAVPAFCAVNLFCTAVLHI
jgi:hypothetical protein